MSGTRCGGPADRGTPPKRSWLLIGLVAVALAVLVFVVVVATGTGEFF